MSKEAPLLGEEKKKRPRTASLLFYATYDKEDEGPVLKSHDITDGPKKKEEKAPRSRMSIMYGADEYTEELVHQENSSRVTKMAYHTKVGKQQALNRDVAESQKDSPDAIHAKQEKEEKKPEEVLEPIPQGVDFWNRKLKRKPKGLMSTENRSLVTNRPYPKPNTDVMRADVHTKFLFTKMTPEMMLHLWDIFTKLFIAQTTWVAIYAVLLRLFPGYFWPQTILFATIMAEFSIQNVYCLHDVAHGATFPPHEWQKYITHCWADMINISWEDLILQHNRHHAATPDLLIHGEFGWDPEEWLYVLQEKSWITCPLVPVWHFCGASDTGVLFALMWYSVFPEDGPGGKRNAQACTKWFPMRVKHQLWLCGLWGYVWLLGGLVTGLYSLSEGWKFMLIVNACSRGGFSIAWTVFTNWNHSHLWNDFLATAPERNYPILTAIMSMVLGGPERFNELLFHDLHHAFPNAVGALSQRGRFYGWKKVHKAAMRALQLGIYQTDETQPESKMAGHNRKRSIAFHK